jgi:hypothetical protein
VLRGEQVAARDFPDLRESYERLERGNRDTSPLVIAELDRITNSVTTLGERVAMLKRVGKA